MLVAATDQRLGQGRFASAVVLDRSIRASVAVRERVVYDSAFAAPYRKRYGVANVYAVVEGVVEVGGELFAAPCAFVPDESEFERRSATAIRLRSWGVPVRLFEVRVAAEAVRGPIGLGYGPVTLAPATWTLLDRLTGALAAASLEDATLTDGLLAVLERLVADGVLAPALPGTVVRDEPEAFRRLWNVLRPLYGDFATSATLKVIADRAGLSLAQAARDLARLSTTMGLGGLGYRDVIRVLRSRMSTLMLSVPGATIAEAAAAVGYGSVDALGRSLRDVGLPGPTAVQAAVRFDLASGRPP